MPSGNEYWLKSAPIFFCASPRLTPLRFVPTVIYLWLFSRVMLVAPSSVTMSTTSVIGIMPLDVGIVTF